jgi:hypothetical protein
MMVNYINSFCAEDGVIRPDRNEKRVYAASMPSMETAHIENIADAENMFALDYGIILNGRYSPSPERTVSMLRKRIMDDSTLSSTMGVHTISRNVDIGIAGHPGIPWLNEGCLKIDFYESFPDFWNPDGRYSGFPIHHMPIPQANFYRKVEWAIDHAEHIEQKNLLYRIAFPGLRDAISSLCVEQEINI